MRFPLLLVSLAGALALAGCALDDDGPRTAQARDVAPFTRVDNRDSVDVRLHVGEPRRVRVRAGEKVIDDVRTEVRDGTLRVTFSHHGWGNGDVEIDAWVPELDGITVGGSGNVDADGLDADALDVRSDGSGDVELAGAVRTLALDLDGSGGADLSGLAAQEARVQVSGSGDADLRAERRLDVRVDGSGDVRYAGRPELSQQVDGSGDVRRAD